VSHGDCPFCAKLSALETLPPGEVVWRFPCSVAFLGPWQFYHGYCVLVARQHARELFHLPDEVRRGYLEEMCLLAKAIDSAFRPHKLNYELLGNQVPHLHWHLFPRSSDDPDHLAPVWLALHRAERDPALLGQIQGTHDRLETLTALRRSLTSLDAPSA
jgi:diadenosine tetraphosphate (Ap4A) HIT family hydrolase